MTKQECKDACDTLSILTGAMRDNKACYLAGNGKCRQDGKYKPGQSTKTSPICKNDGNTAQINLRYHSLYFNVFVDVLTYTIKLFGQCAIDVRTEPTTPLTTTADSITTELGTQIITYFTH